MSTGCLVLCVEHLCGVCWSLCVLCCLSFAVDCFGWLLFVVRCSLFVVRWLLLLFGSSLFVVC